MANDTATTPDLVLLGLLAERPQHGYEMISELERRDVEDWAAVSRPQVYYSLKKLARNGWIEALTSGTASRGPERQVFRITELGSDCLKAGLARADWGRGRTLPPFVTWLALAMHATPEVRRAVVDERARYLSEQIRREEEHLSEVLAEPGRPGTVGVLMVRFTIECFERETMWLDEVRTTLRKLDAEPF